MSEETKNTDAALEGELLNDVTIDEGNTVDEAEAEMSTEERLSQELQQEKEKFLRLFAEFENYKKRTSKERMELFKTAGQEVIVSMLPVLDDFERALKDFNDEKDDVHVQGITLINNKLNETLKQKGLAPTETQVGDTFNADLHEAITQIPAPSDDMRGKIIDIIEKGYTLGDKIIRYPKVVIGQ